jgi:hypothetical protein
MAPGIIEATTLAEGHPRARFSCLLHVVVDRQDLA